MKSLCVLKCWIIMVCLLFCCSVTCSADSGGNLPDSGSDAWQNVVNDIAGQVVVLLPDDTHFRILGIGAIEGDDNSLTEALSAAIKSATDFHLVERVDLDNLLKEQGIQLSPLSDPNGLVEPGKIKGVEGLLMGRVIKKVKSPFYSSLQVFLKLDNVETGSVVFARNFEASYIPATTWYLVGALLALLLFLRIMSGKRKRRKKHILKYSENEAAERQAIEANLKKSRDNLVRAHEILQQTDKSSEAVDLRHSREELGNLLQKLQHGPVVHPENVDKAMEKALGRHNKIMKELAVKVVASSEKVLETAGSGRDVEPALKTLANHLKNAANTAHDRPAGMS